MQFDKSKALFASEHATKRIEQYLRDHADELDLRDEAIAYFGFPLYKGDEQIMVARVLVASPSHGVFVIESSDEIDAERVEAAAQDLEEIFTHVYSKLLRSRKLRKSKTSLKLDVRAVVYAPSLRAGEDPDTSDVELVRSDQGIKELFDDARLNEPLDEDTFLEVRGAIEGANGIIRPKKRETENLTPSSKGIQANLIEQEILGFDSDQRRGAIRVIEGPQRIRGLAGSGKTVVLAMKAALLHLRYPEKKILYTFYTKSLYQHIRRLVTRFYRQFSDEDPNWEQLHILHAWGGVSAPGVYSETTRRLSLPTLSYRDASFASDAFDYVVKKLQAAAGDIQPVYDYVLIDEGQDFPLSFLKLAAALAKEERFVIAADELQTIFQTSVPEAKDILGPGRKFTEDVVLHKCYRNPREVLVCAHALGFGLYGDHIVQMLEDREHWQVIGYQVEGELTEDKIASILRPEENSLRSISRFCDIDQIIRINNYASLEEEARAVARGIAADIKDGLRPDDVLVVSTDDRATKNYFNEITNALFRLGISVNNLHAAMGLADFTRENEVTLATVHKAKGNEAFAVYVVGVDALFQGVITKKKRNMLFTAMTRTKGWLHLSGCTEYTNYCVAELVQAKAHFPKLEFVYPNAETLDLIRRDREDESALRDELAKKLKAGELSDEQMEMLRDMLSNGLRKPVGKRPKSKGDA